MVICTHFVIASTVADSMACYALSGMLVPARDRAVTFHARRDPNTRLSP
jgi:hypothetical protein